MDIRHESLPRVALWTIRYLGLRVSFLIVIFRVIALSGLDLTRTRWYTAIRDNHFDKKYGVRTGSSSDNDFGASPPLGFHLLMSALKIDYKDYTFVDIGSSRGRALLMASEYPFKRIVGVELSEELHEAAKANIKDYRSRTQKCSDIESRLEDAGEFEFPPGPLLIYLFNPLFEDGVFPAILDRLNGSMADDPRHVVIVYFNPTRKALLDSAASLEPVPFEEHMSGLTRKLMPQRQEGDGETWVAIYETGLP